MSARETEPRRIAAVARRDMPAWLWRTLVASVLLLLLYGFGVEPNWVDVTHHSIKARVARRLKIAHLTDLHTDGVGYRERRVLSILRNEAPDLIVLTGDSVVNGEAWAPSPGREDDALHEQAGLFLAQLSAPLGVWAVRGNWENWRRLDREEKYYRTLDIKLLVNAAGHVGGGLWLLGLDDPFSGAPSVETARQAIPQDAFVVALLHSPEYVDTVEPRWDLALAGHTHGGQVRLPWLGAPIVPPGSGRFQAGWYTARGKPLYVSRGIGTSMLPVRFLCRPEVAIFTLVPSADARNIVAMLREVVGCVRKQPNMSAHTTSGLRVQSQCVDG